MKKIRNLLPFLAFMLTLSVHAQSITSPEAGKSYYMIHSSGNILSESTGFVMINAPSATSNQILKFIPVSGNAGVYNIQVASTSTYIIKSGTWDVSLGTDLTLNVAKFTIETVADGTVKIKCLDNSLYLGTDAVAEGSLVYSDKAGTDVKHTWSIVEAVEGQLVLYSLNMAITTAETLKTNAVVGVNPGQFPQGAYNTFSTALDAAKSTKNTATTQIAINAAALTLVNATAAFNAAAIKPVFIPVAGKNYYIVHSSGFFITETSGIPKINEPLGANSQFFKFIAVADTTGIYNLQVVSTGTYITKSGGYNTIFGTDPTSNLAKFKLEVVDGTTSTLKFKCLDNSRYLGTDATTAGSSIYSDKWGTDVKHYWNAQEVVDGGLLKGPLTNAITAAQKLIGSAVVGFKAWEYSQSAYNTFFTAINTASGVLTSATTQADLNSGLASLNTAQAVFTAAANKPKFLPLTGEKYRISTSKYWTQFINCTGGTVTGNQNRIVASPDQMWEFVRVNDTTYIIKNGDNALTGTPSLATYDLTTSTQWTFKYNSTAGAIDYFGIQTGGQCISITSTGAVAMQTYVSTNNAHMVYFVKVDMPNDPDKSSLAAYIPTATTTLNSKTIGTTEGTWSQESFNIFNAVITACKEMMSGSGFTQDIVNAKLAELKAAEVTYNNSRISTTINKTALNAKIESGNSKITSAVIGEQTGQYLMSVIENFKNQVAASKALYATITKQADADAEVIALQVKIDAFVATANQSVISVKTVIDDMVPFAQSLHDNAQVGLDKGQYPASVKATFLNAINLAKAIQTPVRTDLDALVLALSTFKASAVTVERSILKTTLANAKTVLESAVAGTFNGQYSKTKMDELSAALITANNIFNLVAATQTMIDSTNQVIGSKVTALNTSKVVIQFAPLTSAISGANTLLTAAVIGETPGLYKQAVYDAFKAHIDRATTFNGSAQVAQTSVDSVVVVLTSATTAFAAAYNPMIRTALKAILDETQIAYDNAVVGNYNGAYSTATKQSLANSIATAKAVYDKTNANQVEIDNATSVLTKVLSNFKLLAVKVAKTSLLAEINLMKHFADSVAATYNTYSTVSYTKFTTALTTAQTVNNNAFATQAEVDYALFVLKSSKTGLVVTAIETNDLPVTTVFSLDSRLVVKGMTELTDIRIFSLSGQLIRSLTCTEESYSTEMSTGKYIVSISSKNNHKSHVVLVK